MSSHNMDDIEGHMTRAREFLARDRDYLAVVNGC